MSVEDYDVGENFENGLVHNESDGKEEDGCCEDEPEMRECKLRKRKFVGYDEKNAADITHQTLKRLAGPETTSRNTKKALAKHGLQKKGAEAKSPKFKMNACEELRLKGVDPSKLEINIKKKMIMEEKLRLVREQREALGPYKRPAGAKLIKSFLR